MGCIEAVDTELPARAGGSAGVEAGASPADAVLDRTACGRGGDWVADRAGMADDARGAPLVGAQPVNAASASAVMAIASVRDGMACPPHGSVRDTLSRPLRADGGDPCPPDSTAVGQHCRPHQRCGSAGSAGVRAAGPK